MKVAIKLTYNQLTEVVCAVQEDRLAPVINTIADKANNYLFNDAFKRLLKTQINKVDAPKDKAFNIRFSYAEAAALYKQLQDLEYRSAYRMAVLVNITNLIHQKLISQ